MENKTFCRPFILLKLDNLSDKIDNFYYTTSNNKKIPIVGYFDEKYGTIRELLTDVALRDHSLSSDPRIPYFDKKNIDSSELNDIILSLKNLGLKEIGEYVNYIEKHIPCLKIYDTDEVNSILELIGSARKK